MIGIIKKLLLFAFVFFIPSQLSFHFWPSHSMAGGIRIDYLSPAIFVTDLLGLAVILLSLLSRDVSTAYISLIPKNRLIKICAIVILVSSLVSQNPLFSLYKLAKLVGYLFLLRIFISSPKIEKIFIYTFPVSVVWTGLIAISQFAVGRSIGGLFWWVGERPLYLSASHISKVNLDGFGTFLRPYSTFPHPNALAGFMGVSIIILLGFISKEKNHITKKYLALSLMLSLLTLLTTFSVNGILCLIMTGTFFVAVKTRISKILYLLVVIIFLTFVFLPRPESLKKRAELNNLSLSLIKENLLMGKGLGNYVYKSEADLTKYSYQFEPVHNIYLLLLAELGAPFLLLVLICIRRKISYIKSNITVFLIVIYVLLTGAFDHYWITSHQNTLLLAMIGSIVVVQSQKNTLCKSKQ